LEETGEGDVTIVSGLLRSIDAGGFGSFHRNTHGYEVPVHVPIGLHVLYVQMLEATLLSFKTLACNAWHKSTSTFSKPHITKTMARLLRKLTLAVITIFFNQT
jgi:hypothetical protein